MNRGFALVFGFLILSLVQFNGVALAQQEYCKNRND